LFSGEKGTQLNRALGFQELMLLCTKVGFTLICAWSLAEAARYIETYKAYENKGAKVIKVRLFPCAPMMMCLLR
jgi:hypothetical protein